MFEERFIQLVEENGGFEDMPSNYPTERNKKTHIQEEQLWHFAEIAERK